MHFKKSVVLLLIGCMFLSSSAFAAQDGDYTYTESGGNATITAYTGAGGAISIPATLGGYPTVAIGDNAFSSNTTLTSVTIPSSVTSIGNQAFFNCNGLISVNIPDSVTSIENQAFTLCGILTSITVDAGNPNYSSLDGVLYNKTQTTLIQFPGGKSGDFTIPNSVTSIKSQAFISCANLTSVTIPAIVTSIGDNAFSYCSVLTSITVDASNPNYSSQDGVLYDKAKTVLIQYPCGTSGGFTLPSSVTSIGGWAFANCTGLTSVTIPNSVTSIGIYTFSGCSGLTSVSIPDSVTSIAGWAFFGCSNLTGAYFYGNAPTMGSYVFFNCSSGFTVYYLAGSTGFTNPWCPYSISECYPAEVFTPSSTTTTTQPTTTTSVSTTTTSSGGHGGGGGGGGTTSTTTTTAPAVTTTTVLATTTTVPATTTTTTILNTTTTTASPECTIKGIQPTGIKIGFGLLPRIRRVTLTMNTDLEALGITCADLNIQNAPRGIRIISCAVVGDTIEATILFWGVQPGTYNINLGPCGSIPFVVARF